MKEIGRRLLRGSVNLINVSMPVSIFEPRSYLQKLTDPWVFPAMLDRAAKEVRVRLKRANIVQSYHTLLAILRIRPLARRASPISRLL